MRTIVLLCSEIVQDSKTWEGRKPGPVRFRAAIIYLALQLPAASSDQPERARSRAATYFASSEADWHHVVLFVLAPGGVYQAAQVTLGSGGLLPHRFTLTERTQRFTFCCTFPSLATGRRYRPPLLSGARTFLFAFTQSDRMPLPGEVQHTAFQPKDKLASIFPAFD